MKLTTILEKAVFACVVISASTLTVAAANHHQITSQNEVKPVEYSPVQQVVIVGKRMTAEEKLVYDQMPADVIQVQIVGKRLPSNEHFMIAKQETGGKIVRS